MKGLRLSKTSWLILATGVFIVMLAGLGLTRSQQMKEQTQVTDELAMYEKRLEVLQTAQLSQQLENLRIKLEESEAQLKETRDRLDQTVISVDVAEEFFEIVEYCKVKVKYLNTAPIAEAQYEGITCSTISLTAGVTGETMDIVDFIIALNNGYTTGNVKSAQITDASLTEEEELEGEELEGEELEGETDESTAIISMIIYSYEGI